MTKEELDREFFDALKESIDVVPEKYGDKKCMKLYYSEKYKNKMIEKIKSISPKAAVNEDINSMSSSARFAALDLYKYKGIQFEKTITNDIGANTQMDAVVGNIFFECKCHEIFDTKDKLPIRYKTKSGLFQKLIGDEVEKSDTTKNKDGDEFVTYSMKTLGIDLPGKNWCKLHVDLKQMICHIIAIANKNGGIDSVLQYVFYKPSEASIEKHHDLKCEYMKLEEEIEAIWKQGNKITDFCEAHSITLAAPIFKNVNHIEDFVLKELRGSN